MTIKINEKGSENFYKEIINVSAEYAKLLRKPDAKLIDEFRAWKRYIICGSIILAITLLELILFGSDTLMWVMFAVLALLIACSTAMQASFNTRLKAFLEGPAESELTLDDDGIELKSASSTVRISWENIAFARVFDESICFLAKSQTSLVLSVSKKYYDEIKPFIKCKLYEK